LAHMSVNSIDSDQYVDRSIDTVHIGLNQVTLAEMAGGTDGNLITYDTSGNPAYVATGANDQVLTSNGPDTVPTFQAAAGGGPSQASSSAIIAETDESTYINPRRVKNAPTVLKAWVVFKQTGTVAIHDSYNVSGLVDDGPGVTQITFGDAFGDEYYAAAGVCGEDMICQQGDSGIASTDFTEVTQHNNGSRTDSGKVWMMFGGYQ